MPLRDDLQKSILFPDGVGEVGDFGWPSLDRVATLEANFTKLIPDTWGSGFWLPSGWKDASREPVRKI